MCAEDIIALLFCKFRGCMYLIPTNNALSQSGVPDRERRMNQGNSSADKVSNARRRDRRTFG